MKCITLGIGATSPSEIFFNLLKVNSHKGCPTLGTVLPRSSGKNIYNINVTFTGTNCALGNGGTASGIFVLDRTVTPNIALTLALTPNKQDGFIGIGTKQ